MSNLSTPVMAHHNDWTPLRRTGKTKGPEAQNVHMLSFLPLTLRDFLSLIYHRMLYKLAKVARVNKSNHMISF